MGYQYDPKRVWYLFNEIYNTTKGICSGSTNQGGREDMYILGNKIHRTDDGIQLNNGDNPEYIIDNTIYASKRGISNSELLLLLKPDNTRILQPPSFLH